MTTQTATPHEIKVQIDALLANQPLVDCLLYLFDRWQDEAEYEDFAEYGKRLQHHLPEAFTFVKATKRPFGMEFSHPQFPAGRYAIRVTSNSLYWRRVK